MAVVPNLSLVSKTNAIITPAKIPGIVRLMFLSRISPKKNLDLALRSLELVRLQKGEKIYLEIYGPAEDEAYLDECKIIASRLPSGIEISWNGSIPPEKTAQLYATSHFLFLPTRNENYGHVIVESLQQGCPVIISDQTPWRGLEKANAGFDLSLSELNNFVAAIISILKMTDSEYRKYREGAIEYASKNINTDRSAAQMRSLFQRLTEK